ncbi:MAG: hypothetical protein LBS19_12355 [Clostridiales bacterium]|jgi:hypothetical protein|nr:hypothetical protein [Clostridiales bacterium]
MKSVCAILLSVFLLFNAAASAVAAEPLPSHVPEKYDVYGNPLNESFFIWRGGLNAAEQAAYDLIYRHAVMLEPDISLAEPIGADRVQNVLDAVRFDNPELFWLSDTLRYYYIGEEATGLILNFTPDYTLLPAYKAAFEERTNALTEYAAHLPSDAERVKFIHDYLTYSIEYDVSAVEDQSAFGAAVIGRAVCIGYALSFNYYMQRLGIPSILVKGMAKGDAHVWNLVCIGGEYYNMDITWDDPEGNPANSYYYNYYNVTDKQLEGSHFRSIECKGFPEASGDVFAYNAAHYPSAYDFASLSVPMDDSIAFESYAAAFLTAPSYPDLPSDISPEEPLARSWFEALLERFNDVRQTR